MFKVITSFQKLLRLSGTKVPKFYNIGFQSRCVNTSKMNCEKAIEDLQANPYFEKYAHKIAALENTSQEEFLSRLKANEERKHTKKTDKTTSLPPLAGKPGLPKTSSNITTKPKVLSDVMKTELIEGKQSEEINTIWLEYHKNKDCIAASVPISNYELIKVRSELYPLFLLPLPREQGYEFILCQFSGNEVHFTPLISYQTHKENAPECLTIVYYPDLKETKGIVLMRGEYNKEVLTAMEAQCLANELQLYYGEENEKRTRLLETFTNCPDDFRHMDLIANLESLSL